MLSSRELTVLSETFLFSGVRAAEIGAMLEKVGFERQSFERSSVIYSPEDFSKKLGIILSGRILVEKRSFVVNELGSGDLFGAAALFNDEPRYVSTLTARTPAKVLFITQESVKTLIDTSPILRDNYLRYLSERIRFLSSKVDSLSSGSGEKKLSSFLLGLADGEGHVNVHSITELASRLNMGRASLYRELTKLEERGIISRDGKSITVLKPELLE